MRDYIYLIAPVIAWPIAQGCKFIVRLVKHRRVNWTDMVQSGGMPSSHSTMMLAILTVVGLEQGIASIYFAITLSLVAIVIYDSLGVRRTTGEQTVAINELAGDVKKPLRTVIHDAKGHSYREVVVGCLVGFMIGIVLYAILK